MLSTIRTSCSLCRQVVSPRHPHVRLCSQCRLSRQGCLEDLPAGRRQPQLFLGPSAGPLSPLSAARGTDVSTSSELQVLYQLRPLRGRNRHRQASPQELQW